MDHNFVWRGNISYLNTMHVCRRNPFGSGTSSSCRYKIFSNIPAGSQDVHGGVRDYILLKKCLAIMKKNIENDLYCQNDESLKSFPLPFTEEGK
jgi:hypothetical protein